MVRPGYAAPGSAALTRIGDLPALGAPGAALATVISMAAWNLMLHRIVLRRIGVRPSPLSWLLAPRLAERAVS